jgi:hypothetical protein
MSFADKFSAMTFVYVSSSNSKSKPAAHFINTLWPTQKSPVALLLSPTRKS